VPDQLLLNGPVGRPNWHIPCFCSLMVGSRDGPGWVKSPSDDVGLLINPWSVEMTWTKPEAEVVAVTMEVTAYVATL
jgi:hypothetical protein